MDDNKPDHATKAWAVISHDIASPLTVMINSFDFLAEQIPMLLELYKNAKEAGLAVPPLTDKKLERIERSTFAGQNAAQSICQYMDRLNKKFFFPQHSVELYPFSIATCVENAINTFVPKFGLRDNSNVTQAITDTEVIGDKKFLTWVIYEILSNADYYMLTPEETGTLAIEGNLKGDVYHLSFKDTGCGIVETDLPYVFDAYFSTRRKIGLGLYFCQQIIRRFNGDIKCHSQEGKFTEVILILPADHQS